MMQERIESIRYGIGDFLGDRSPSYFRRRRSSNDLWMRAGGVAAAAGIGFLAYRFADRRLGQLASRMRPRYGRAGGRSREMRSEGSSIHEVGSASHIGAEEIRHEWPNPENQTAI